MQEAVYTMCNRLGVMTQSDLPHFAQLRRPQFAEAVRQAGEMERLLCPHPCNILVSYFNEPFPVEWGVPTARHLTRDELERFFIAADQLILSINPDRVIKPVDGDYDPPAPGLLDNHTYTLWYVGHMIDAGALHAGEWMAIKPGWNYACGEFGAEGLDSVDLMRRRYPASWLPERDDDPDWTPAQIVDAQTGSHYCFFYDRPRSLPAWVAASQAHQAFAMRWMTEAFRRDRRMISFAIHLFIDAWPAGWMKTIIDCERRAKPAWYAYRDALAPLHLSLRTDRFTCFSGETIPVEVWIANDSGTSLSGASIRYQIVSLDGETAASGESNLPALATCDVHAHGVIPFHASPVQERTKSRIEAFLLDADGTTQHQAVVEIEVFPPLASTPRTLHLLSGPAWDWLPEAHHRRLHDSPYSLEGDRLFSSGLSPCDPHWPRVLQSVREGLDLVVLDPALGEWEIDDYPAFHVEECGMGPRHFVSRATGHPLVADFEPDDFRLLFDEGTGRIAPILNRILVGPGGTSVLSSGQLGWGQPFVVADAVREYRVGEGSLLFCSLELKGRLGNPVLRAFFERLIAPAGRLQQISKNPC